jgi:hypothetical protein
VSALLVCHHALKVYIFVFMEGLMVVHRLRRNRGEEAARPVKLELKEGT